MTSAKSKKPAEVGTRSAAVLLPGQPPPDIRKRVGGARVVGAAGLLLGVVAGCNQPGPAPASSPSGSSAQATGSPAPAVSPADLAPAAARRLPAPTTGATVIGRALLIGRPPAIARLPRGSDPYCARTPIPDEALLVDGQGGLGNVLVRVVEGAAGPYLPPREPVTLTQAECRYRPRVVGIVRGQPVQVSNSDATMHNVHALLGQGTVLNLIQVDPAAPLIDLRPVLMAAKTNPLKLRCDIHPWMTAYLWVLDHPFFAVTAADGTFAIKNLAAGEYVLEAWHEQLGTRRAKLSIPPSAAAPAKPARAEFRFTLETTAPLPTAPAPAGG